MEQQQPDPNSECFNNHLDQWLNVMPGSWVAILDGTLIDVADTREDLFKRSSNWPQDKRMYVDQVIPQEDIDMSESSLSW